MKDNTAAVHAQVPVEVASFLLNEKRTEIAKIEIQQRLNVLLVPNKTLETPNYKLERLKHDDPRLDKLEASYKMAEEFEDPTAVTRRSQEPTNKQTPVIKGVLPDLPAPIVEPKPAAAPKVKPADKAHSHKKEKSEKGFFAWLKGLFSGDAAEEKSTTGKKPADKKDDKRDPREGRESRDGRGRGGRGGRGGRNAERGGERGASGDRAERTNERTHERTGTDKGEGRSADRSENASGRGPRQDRNRGNRQAGEAQNQNARPSNDEANDDKSPEAQAEARSNARNERMAREERGEQPRRERAPRGENRRGERPRHDEAAQVEGAVPADNAGQTATLSSTEGNDRQERMDDNNGERRERRSRDRYGRDRRERGGERNTERSDSAADATHVSQNAESSSSSVKTTVEAPVRDSMPRVTSFTLSVSELQTIAQGSGLEWVNSNAERIAAVQAAIAAEPKPVHVPRERPAPVVMDEGPLVLVETRKDL